MALDSVAKLGITLGSVERENNLIAENLNEKDNINIDTIRISETQETTGVLRGYKLQYSLDSFIIDHVVLGELDSTTLKLDSGYTGEGLSFPVTFPVSFNSRTKIFEVTI